VRGEIDGGRYQPMVDLIPQYTEPVGRVLPRG